MRTAPLATALLIAACAPMPDAEPGPASTAAPSVPGLTDDAPEIAVLGMGERAVLSVTFRGPSPQRVSAGRPAVVRTGSGAVEAEPIGPPAQSVENGRVQVTSASYALTAAQARALQTPGPGATIEVHDGQAYRSYPFVRTDIVR